MTGFWLYWRLSRFHLRTGSRLHWARAYLISLLWERSRIVAWHRRHLPISGDRYGWLDAWRATVENPASVDHMWDDEFEEDTDDGA